MPRGGSLGRSDTRWWGWGDPTVRVDVGDSLRQLLREQGFEIDESRSRQPAALEDVALPSSRELPTEVISAAGSANVSVDRESRIRHASGQSLLDLIRLRDGRLDSAPDAVVLAREPRQVQEILVAASRTGVGVIPYGGGTSVVGGVTPSQDPDRTVVALATAGLVKCELDPISRSATLGAGLRGPEAESFLNAHGLTLGHWPQSWEYATIGGFAATRSAGQASNGYGRFDEMVLGARLVSPTGSLGGVRVSHSSEGPSLLDVVLGSEGVLGIITEVEVAVSPQPVVAREAWILPDFETGVDLVRSLAQNGPLPAVVRLSDEAETSLNLAMSSPGGVLGRLFDSYLGLRGVGEGSLLILGFEGKQRQVRIERSEVQRRVRRIGGISLGPNAGKAWERGRFHGPYLREGLLDLGLIVETFETAAPWSSYGAAVREIARATGEAMARSDVHGRLLCHLSHAYADSASLYFTLVASPGPGGPAESWRTVKAGALGAIQELELPISHHHGIGRDHREAFAIRVGETGLQGIEGLRGALDPEGIMNPGCLLPEPDRHTP